MRFIGNKEKLLDTIFYELSSRGISGESFFDFFSGTSNVAKFYKEKNYTVFSSDLMYFSYVLQRAYIQNNQEPSFEKLLKTLDYNPSMMAFDNLDIIIDFLDNLTPKAGYIYYNYSPEGTCGLEKPRMFFTGENAKKIDTIRTQIEQWNKDKLISEHEYFILLACVIETVPFYANISGVQGRRHITKFRNTRFSSIRPRPKISH